MIRDDSAVMAKVENVTRATSVLPFYRTTQSVQIRV